MGPEAAELRPTFEQPLFKGEREVLCFPEILLVQY